MDAIALRLLGAPTVVVGGRREPLPFTTPTSLLLYLAVAGDWVARHELAYLYRPDEPDTVALQYLRLQLHRAQRAPWARGLEVEADQVRWTPASDLAAFEAAFTAQDWAAAVDTYGGPLLGSFALRDKPTFETWLELERDGVEQRYKTALERRSAELIGRGALEEATDVLGRRACVDALDEAATAAYLEALGRIGRKADARRHYDGFVKVLREELDAAPAEATVALMERIEADEVADAAPVRSRPRDTVPQPATRFIGRRLELTEIEERLARDDCRLLTIVGLGGTGKTRLALELARRSVGRYADGVHFMPLVAVSQTAELVERIAEVTGVEIGPSADAAPQLIEHLADHHLLLLLDNFEHLDGAAFLADLLAGTRHLTAVVTSRRPLHVRGEWLYDLHGVRIPDASLSLGDASELLTVDAVDLFVAAARRVAPRLAFDADDLREVAKIARHVEGMPLALELAASWVRLMPVARIAEEVASGTDLLASDLVDLPERHRSVDAVIGRTWEELDDAKKRALARLSVFVDGSTLEAAERVTEAHVSVLLSLVNQSLVQRQGADRFASHALVGQYAATMLVADPFEHAAALDAHAAAYAERLRDVAERPETGSSEALKALGPDLANVEKAWLRLLDEGAIGVALPIAKPLFDYYLLLGHYRRGGELCRASLARLGRRRAPDEASLEVMVLLAATSIAREAGSFVEARRSSDEALALATEFALAPLIAQAHRHGGDVRQLTGDYAAAEASYEQALAAFEDLGDVAETANTLNSLGSMEAMQERFERATQRFERCVVLFGEVGDELSRAIALNNLGYIADASGAFEVAARRYEESLVVFERLAYPRGISSIKNNLVVLYGTLGRLEEAEAAGLESLALKEAVGDTVGRVITMKNLGDLQLMQGAPERAAAYYLPAIRLAVELEATPRLVQVLTGYAEYLHVTERAEQARTLMTALLQHPATPPSLVDKVRRMVPELEWPAAHDPAPLARAVESILQGA